MNKKRPAPAEARTGRGRRLVRMNRVRWFEAFLIFYVLGWLFVIWAAGDPPRFFL